MVSIFFSPYLLCPLHEYGEVINNEEYIMNIVGLLIYTHANYVTPTVLPNCFSYFSDVACTLSSRAKRDLIMVGCRGSGSSLFHTR